MYINEHKGGNIRHQYVKLKLTTCKGRLFSYGSMLKGKMTFWSLEYTFHTSQVQKVSTSRRSIQFVNFDLFHLKNLWPMVWKVSHYQSIALGPYYSCGPNLVWKPPPMNCGTTFTLVAEWLKIPKELNWNSPTSCHVHCSFYRESALSWNKLYTIGFSAIALVMEYKITHLECYIQFWFYKSAWPSH